MGLNRKQYWAAIAQDGEILTVGLTMFGRFERCCLGLSCGGYMKWVKEGSRYAELFVDSLREFYNPGFVYGLNIKSFPHGRIRHCKSAWRI